MPRSTSRSPSAARWRRSGTSFTLRRPAVLFTLAGFARFIFLVLFDGLGGLVGGEAVIERLQADAEHVGRLALRAAFGKRRLDQPAAHVVERRADANGEDRR